MSEASNGAQESEVPPPTSAGGSAPPTAVVDPNDDQRILTKEEQREYQLKILGHCRDIQQLVVTLKKTEKMMREDICDLVIQEAVEAQAYGELSQGIEDRQREALCNPAYIRWAMARGKGEFSLPSAQDRDAAQGGTPEWVPLMDPQYVPSLPSLLDSKLIGLLARWRSPNSSLAEKMDALISRIEEFAATLPAGAISPAIAINGTVLLDSDVTRSLIDDPKALNAVVQQCARASTPEEAYVSWIAKITNLTFSKVGAVRTVLQTSASLPDILRDDGSDFLCLVPGAKACVPLRAIVVHRALKAIEVQGPTELNILHGASPNFTENDLISLVQRFVEASSDIFARQEYKKSIVALSLCFDEQGTPTLCVTDLRPLSPDIPFAHHLSWSDVCGIIQLSSDAVIVKRMRTAVASLTAFDEDSEKWFPHLVAAMQGGKAPQGSSSAHPQPITSATRAKELLVISIAVALGTFLVTRWASRR